MIEIARGKLGAGGVIRCIEKCSIACAQKNSNVAEDEIIVASHHYVHFAVMIEVRRGDSICLEPQRSVDRVPQRAISVVEINMQEHAWIHRVAAERSNVRHAVAVEVGHSQAAKDLKMGWAVNRRTERAIAMPRQYAQNGITVKKSRGNQVRNAIVIKIGYGQLQHIQVRG